MLQIPNDLCPICNIKLTQTNVSLKDWTNKPEIRLDSMGRAWCKLCTEQFDSIDWSEEGID